MQVNPARSKNVKEHPKGNPYDMGFALYEKGNYVECLHVWFELYNQAEEKFQNDIRKLWQFVAQSNLSDSEEWLYRCGRRVARDTPQLLELHKRRIDALWASSDFSSLAKICDGMRDDLASSDLMNYVKTIFYSRSLANVDLRVYVGQFLTASAQFLASQPDFALGLDGLAQELVSWSNFDRKARILIELERDILTALHGSLPSQARSSIVSPLYFFHQSGYLKKRFADQILHDLPRESQLMYDKIHFEKNLILRDFYSYAEAKILLKSLPDLRDDDAAMSKVAVLGFFLNTNDYERYVPKTISFSDEQWKQCAAQSPPETLAEELLSAKKPSFERFLKASDQASLPPPAKQFLCVLDTVRDILRELDECDLDSMARLLLKLKDDTHKIAPRLHAMLSTLHGVYDRAHALSQRGAKRRLLREIDDPDSNAKWLLAFAIYNLSMFDLPKSVRTLLMEYLKNPCSKETLGGLHVTLPAEDEMKSESWAEEFLSYVLFDLSLEESLQFYHPERLEEEAFLTRFLKECLQ